MIKNKVASRIRLPLICFFLISLSLPTKANDCHNHLKLKTNALICYFFAFLGVLFSGKYRVFMYKIGCIRKKHSSKLDVFSLICTIFT